MANDVVFVKKQGGLGRPLTGEDHISGLLFYSDATLPSGFSSSDRIKKIFSIEEAEDLGITDTHLGETKAVAKITIGGTPAIGDTLKVEYTGIDGIETVLSTYALVSGEETTTTTAATAYRAQINATTSSTGFSAAGSGADILITTKEGEGVFPNTGAPYTATVTGANTATVTQPTGSGSTVLGVASDIDILHYHISEYFRIQPKGQLFVDIEATADVATFSKITTLQNYAVGKIRQVGVYQKSTAFSTAHLTTLQGICDDNYAVRKPLQVIYQGQMSAVTLSTLSDLRALDAPDVSAVIGQDGANVGNHLWYATNKSIGIVGCTLGAVSLAKVNEDIAWIAKFNVSETELDTLAYANGALYSAQSDGLISNINDLGYIGLIKYVDLEGSYFNDSHTAVSVTSDFAYIENGRTFNKAIRNLRKFILPSLASPLLVNANGTLNESVIGYFETLCQRALDEMVREGEISAFEVVIDPSQDVLATSELVISVSIVPVGVARTITVNVGFTTSI